MCIIFSSIVVVDPLLLLFFFHFFSIRSLVCSFRSIYFISLKAKLLVLDTRFSRIPLSFYYYFSDIFCFLSLLAGVETGVYFYSFVWGALITLYVRVRFKWLDTHSNLCARISFSSGHKNSSSLIFIHRWWKVDTKKNNNTRMNKWTRAAKKKLKNQRRRKKNKRREARQQLRNNKINCSKYRNSFTAKWVSFQFWFPCLVPYTPCTYTFRLFRFATTHRLPHSTRCYYFECGMCLFCSTDQIGVRWMRATINVNIFFRFVSILACYI